MVFKNAILAKMGGLVMMAQISLSASRIFFDRIRKEA
jgi:hypothetical protein